MALQLSRTPGESIVIRVGGQKMCFTIMEVRGRKVWIDFAAGEEFEVNRLELDAVKHPSEYKPCSTS